MTGRGCSSPYSPFRAFGQWDLTDPLLLLTTPREPRLFSFPHQIDKHGRSHHPGLYRLQETELHHYEEQEERSRPDRADEVLQVGSQAHTSPGDQIADHGSNHT